METAALVILHQPSHYDQPVPNEDRVNHLVSQDMIRKGPPLHMAQHTHRILKITDLTILRLMAAGAVQLFRRVTSPKVHTSEETDRGPRAPIRMVE